MPTTDDYDKNDRAYGGNATGFTPAQSESVDKQEQSGTATGAPKEAASTPKEVQEYVPWSRFESANSDVSKREADKLTGRVQSDVGMAQGDLSSAQAGFDQTVGKSYGATGQGAGEQSAGDYSSPTEMQSAATPGQAPGSSPIGSTDAAQEQPAPLFGQKKHGRKAPPAQGAAPATPAPQEAETQSSSPTTQSAQPTQQTTGNPWAALAGFDTTPGRPQPPPGYVPDTPTQQPQLPPPLSDAERQAALTQDALSGDHSAAQDLETTSGKDAWTKLLGDTVQAEQEANALGSESGVQALLQRGNPNPIENSGFDAALLEGPGQKEFGDVAGKYGKGQLEDAVVNAEQASQDRWKQLQGDIDARKAREAAAAQQGGEAPVQAAESHPDETGTITPDDGTGQPMNIHSMLFGDGQADAWSSLHEAGISMSPADQLDITAAEASDTDIPLPTEAFVSAVTGALAKQTQDAWPAAKVEMAFGRVASHYGNDGLQALLHALKSDPAMLKAYLNMKNPGYMSSQMSKWLTAHGYQQRQQHNQHEVRGLGQGTTYTDPTGHQRTTTDDQESQRVLAYRNGWGQSWDDQFNSGIDEPEQGGKPKESDERDPEPTTTDT